MGYLRVTEGYMSQNVLNNVMTNRDLLIELQKQIASGTKIDRASQDVFSATTILSSNASLGKLDTYLSNIDLARSELETADKALLTTVDSVHTARELTIQGLNATSGPDELNIMANQIDQLIEQVKDMGNTKFGTKYIFGGQNTSTAPFTEGMFSDEIQYNGSADGTADRNIEIAEGVVLAVNIGGDEVFGYHYTSNDNGTPADRTDDTVESQGLIGTLIKLRDEMLQAEPDKDVIRGELANLEDDLQTLLRAQSTLGGKLTRLDITEGIHENDKINLTDAKSNAQDVDMAQAISDLTFQETALQASLQVSARIIQPSIMNYL